MKWLPWIRRVSTSFSSAARRSSRRRHRVFMSVAAETERMEPRCLLAAGVLDTTFGTGGEATFNFNNDGRGYSSTSSPRRFSKDQGAAVAIQSDGKILIAGRLERSSTSDVVFGVTRFNSNGRVDTTFGSSGTVTITFPDGGGALRNDQNKATGIAVQSNGKIVVVGNVDVPTTTSNNKASIPLAMGVARLNSNGTYDSTFDGDGRRIISFGSGTSQATGVAIASDGKIIVAGTKSPNSSTSSDSDFAVARLTTTGALDTTFSGDGKQTVAFDIGGGLGDYCKAVAIQTDGKIVLAGSATIKVVNTSPNSSETTGDFAVARLTTSGVLDQTFDGDGKRTIAFDRGGTGDDQCNAVTISSGKIVLAGSARFNNTGDHDFALARLNSNGSLDSSFDGDGKRTFGFDIGGDKYDAAYAVKVQSDGKIVVAGSAKAVGLNSDYAVARLTSSGAYDTTFNGTGKRASARSGDDSAQALAIQSNGRLVLAGYSNINGTYDFAVARILNS